VKKLFRLPAQDVFISQHLTAFSIVTCKLCRIASAKLQVACAQPLYGAMRAGR
jgi:hypothetical protein